VRAVFAARSKLKGTYAKLPVNEKNKLSIAAIKDLYLGSARKEGEKFALNDFSDR
jgi:hypothetical protein